MLLLHCSETANHHQSSQFFLYEPRSLPFCHQARMSTGENGLLWIDMFMNRVRIEEKSSALKRKALQILPSVCETHFKDVPVLSPRPVRGLPGQVRNYCTKSNPPRMHQSLFVNHVTSIIFQWNSTSEGNTFCSIKSPGIAKMAFSRTKFIIMDCWAAQPRPPGGALCGHWHKQQGSWESAQPTVFLLRREFSQECLKLPTNVSAKQP